MRQVHLTRASHPQLQYSDMRGRAKKETKKNLKGVAIKANKD